MRQNRFGAGAARLPGLLARCGLSVGLGGLFVWLLSTRLAEVDPVAVSRAIAGVEVMQWSLAVTATAISFWAVGHYDAVVHRCLETGIAPAVARRAGICAIAVSQMLGLGVITGTVVRLRLLPGHSSALAARLTVAVALSFLAGWAVVTAIVLLVLPDAPFRSLAVVVLTVAALAVAAKFAWPNRTLHWPNLFSQTRLVFLTAVDTIAAALALYCLLPPDLGISLVALLPAFLIAQGAGLVSGSPGGVGAFEVTLLALLPQLPPDPVLAAIVAWRMTYYALPALLGGLVAAIGPRSAKASVARPVATTGTSRAELRIAAQGDHHRLASGDWLVGRTPHVLVGMFDPLTASRSALHRLTEAARQSDRVPAIYKCNARMAAFARAEGWQVSRIAREASLVPGAFDLSLPSRSGLRRKLRKADAAGVHESAATFLPTSEMAQIAAVWAVRQGGERGFSMGRYAADYVKGQRVFLARHNGRLVAFASFHETRSEWALDLMRHDNDTPDGTMHALVAAAISQAARQNVQHLSLAAVPEAAFGSDGLINRALARLGCDGAGLLQFKAAFDPRWVPLYLAAPHRSALALAACEIARAIAAPPPLRKTEQDHADYGFAMAR